jgi:hypothetical protein
MMGSPVIFTVLAVGKYKRENSQYQNETAMTGRKDGILFRMYIKNIRVKNQPEKGNNDCMDEGASVRGIRGIKLLFG